MTEKKRTRKSKKPDKVTFVEEVAIPVPEPEKEIVMEQPEYIDSALMVPIERTDLSPQERAKMVRKAFSKLGYPNEEHPETVRDFMIKHDIPVIDRNAV